MEARKEPATDPSAAPPEEAEPCGLLDLTLLASRTVSQYISVHHILPTVRYSAIAIKKYTKRTKI